MAAQVPQASQGGERRVNPPYSTFQVDISCRLYLVCNGQKGDVY
jgi:hypothetical protein